MRQRGIGTVLGATFFVLLVMLALSSMMGITAKFDEFQSVTHEMREFDRDKLSENLRIDSVVVNGTRLNMTITNAGGVTTHLVQLWIINQSTPTGASVNIHRNFGIDLFVLPGETVPNFGTNFFLSPTGNRYQIRLVSERGNIFSTTFPPPLPFRVPRFSNSTLSPNSGLFRDPKFNDPFVKDGKAADDAWIEFCNTGTVKVSVNLLARLIFVNVATPGVEFVGGVFQWADTTGKTFPLDQNNDSAPLPPGACLRLGFKDIQNLLQTKDTLKLNPGTYRVFVSLVGFDETGAVFIQNIEITTITFTG